MRLVVVGCSGSIPGPTGPASCYLLQAEHLGRTWSIILDLGNGALGPLQSHLDPLRLDAVLLSHLHPDHCLDLTALHVMCTHHPTATPPGLLPLFGPRGTQGRLERARGIEGGHSIADVFEIHQVQSHQEIAVGPFTILPISVNHPVETFGYRVSCYGATLAYTADTDSCPGLISLMADADLVLADSAFAEGRDAKPGIHLSGRRAAQAALAAGGVQRLMLTHIPPWTDPEVCRAEASEVWPGEVELAQPGGAYLIEAPS